MALTVDEFKKAVAAEKLKQRPAQKDECEDWGNEIDQHPIHNPTKTN